MKLSRKIRLLRKISFYSEDLGPEGVYWIVKYDHPTIPITVLIESFCDINAYGIDMIRLH